MIGNFSNKYQKIISVLGAALLFLPKINLISVAGQSAGIRIDDIVLLVLAIPLFLSFKLNAINKIEMYLGLMLFAFFLSNVFNTYFFNRSNILYSFRYVEYIIFFYIGYLYSKNFDINKLLIGFLCINGSIMILQTIGLMGGFSSEGFVDDSSARAIGLTGGPWEIGAIINFIFCLLVFGNTEHPPVSNKRLYVIFVVTFALILLTGARMPTLTHLVLLMIALYRRSKVKLFFLFKIAAVIIPFILAVLLIPNKVVSRSENLLSMENIDLFIYDYNHVKLEKDFKGFPDILYSDDADMSWLMRMAKWTYALRAWNNTSLTYAIGVGPGAWGPALDGGWIRLLTETGIIGLTTFFLSLKRIATISFSTTAIVLSLFINMLMIDIHIAYKAMSILFFIAGYSYSKHFKTALTFQSI
ncbi:O-antigen ligase family protein [Mucilaginibacter aquatilis]|uniref:O-antigen ligase domain-containing protein n=1 Tax=Mucilaginibacter aquatilis TaxID=1517760 RepID=A0A6I4I822_9SPHI|nr:O-antigen ligase family protein [Mucilaginibacter aquatilis]MVN91202.1 hypothetical protein [Mucilaginibacter aquatilis]